MKNLLRLAGLYLIVLTTTLLMPTSVYAKCDRGKVVIQPIKGVVSEADGNIQLTVSRKGGTCGEASVVLEAVSLSAKKNVDFLAEPKRLTWRSGEGGNRFYPIKIIDDKFDEPNETFMVVVIESSHHSLINEGFRKIVTIEDNDKQPIVKFGSGIHEVSEGNQIRIPIELSAPSGYDINVKLLYTGSATTGINPTRATSINFASLPTTIVIPKGEIATTLELSAVSDGLPNTDKSLEIYLGEAKHAKIIRDDRTYRLRVRDPIVTACPAGVDRWSDPSSWPEGVPIAGSAVEIPEGTHIALDVDTATLAGLTINGTLSFCRQDLVLTADWILLTGELHIGSETDPFTHQANITLTGDTTENVMGFMGSRGLLVMNGILELHGNAPEVVWTKINEHAEVDTTQLTLDQPVDWRVGDNVVLAPTDFYGVAQTEWHQIAAMVDDQTIHLVNPLSAFRWGRLQYVTSTGMSLTNDDPVSPPADPEVGNTPLILDERAPVGNLTRNIVIQAPNDTLWQQQGFGAHLMIMGQSSQTHIDGVEFRRVGQRHRLGRYPYHNHRRSYDNDGLELNDVTGDYLRNSSIHQSNNRCITIHATNGLTVQNNICFDIRGHGIFFEDAVERRNTVENNLILHVRNPEEGMALKIHERSDEPDIQSGSSGLWVSNPDNIVRNNTAADAEGFGLWMAFPEHPVGASSNVAILPNRLLFGNFDGNTTHSNALQGTMIDNVEIDDLGNLSRNGITYVSTVNGQNSFSYPDDVDNLRRFSIRGHSSWKNGSSGFWNRVVWPDYSEFVSADNQERFIAGSGAEGVITRSLLVGTSLNNFTPPPNRSWLGSEVAFASYHSTYSIYDNITVNFPLVSSNPLVAGGRSGAFDTSDYYLRPVERGTLRNTNNLLINSHPGYRARAFFPHYVLAGAMLDPQGIWGPANNWSVYDQPFFTHNANCIAVEPADSSGAMSCDGQYYGAMDFVLNQANEPFDTFMAILVTRFDEADPNVVVDNWIVNNAYGLSPFPNMRHFTTRSGGIYLLDFPEEPIPDDVIFRLDNMHTMDDTVVIGVRYSGFLSAQVVATTYNPNNVNGFCNDQHCHSYTPVASLADVISSDGETFWQDTANNIVWAKVRGGLVPDYVAPSDNWPFSDALLYRPFRLRIHN